jgi:phospholipid/cholesterol/gamma-HCH transport system substrate-binding protein
MRSRWNLPIYVAYVVISLVVVTFIVAQMGLTFPWAHPYTITAHFSDAADVLTNNEVYLNGVRVGHVGGVNVHNGQAQVELVIDDGQAQPIYQDASAEVRKKNLLGETYIDLQRGGSAARMQSGGTIPVNHTVPITEIDQVLAIFDPETVQRVQLLINALGNATTNNGRNLNAEATSTNQLLTALNGPATELSARQQQLNDIVIELQRLYAVLAQQREQVKEEFVTWNQVMRQLADQESGIAGTVQQGDTLLQNLDALVSGTSPSGQPRAQEISAILQELGNPSSDGAIANLQSFLSSANSIIAAIAPYRQYVNDVFPDLQSSFADTINNDGVTQHVWSVFSVNCPTPNTCNGKAQPASGQSGPPASTWAAMGTGGAG